ncbi:hypothetical protein LIPSTDRAFT_249433 [Lipomyces starkeyi NRRL Y-11557]|uniref:Uncharacterized protein n=1 Tax=Lipomyces starkeyi NRRL Y-11557 TaxID=675824 RepID=A0A1E3QAV4_LIPST|nr:hypothetical protein LIPSTDRAFT_249433 [Lipomyces starkeyi NRRL Y-11557]
MQAVRQKDALRPKGTSQAYDPIQRRFTISEHTIGLTASLDANRFSRNVATVCRWSGSYRVEAYCLPPETELVDKGCHGNRKEPYTDNTLKSHVAVITDLLRHQVDFGVKPHPKPRTANVQAILNTYSMNTYERREIERSMLIMAQVLFSMVQHRRNDEDSASDGFPSRRIWRPHSRAPSTVQRPA